MKNLTLQKIRDAHKKTLIDKNLKWFRSQGFTGKDFDLIKEAERFAEVDLQLETDWIFTSRTDLSDLPNWVKQLYWYELGMMYPHRDKKKISLAGTINPNPDKYNMKGFPDAELQTIRHSICSGERGVRDNECSYSGDSRTTGNTGDNATAS